MIKVKRVKIEKMPLYYHPLDLEALEMDEKERQANFDRWYKDRFGPPRIAFILFIPIIAMILFFGWMTVESVYEMITHKIGPFHSWYLSQKEIKR